MEVGRPAGNPVPTSGSRKLRSRPPIRSPRWRAEGCRTRPGFPQPDAATASHGSPPRSPPCAHRSAKRALAWAFRTDSLAFRRRRSFAAAGVVLPLRHFRDGFLGASHNIARSLWLETVRGAKVRALCRRGRRPRSLGRADMGGTRRFAPDALAARVYNSGVPGLLHLLLETVGSNGQVMFAPVGDRGRVWKSLSAPLTTP